MSKHTPEPWEYGFPKVNGQELREADCQVSMGGFLIANVSHGPIYPEEPFGSAAREANALRIVACVNACAGMTDPAAEIAELKRQRDELLATLGASIQLIKQARLDWCDHNAESYDEDVVTPYDAILYRPILSLLETKGSAS